MRRWVDGNALSALLLVLFLLFVVPQSVAGQRQYNQDQRVTVVGYFRTSRFWFESLQNWQSEFLAVGSLVVFGIFLRERSSPEPKPVAAPHGETGR